MIQLENWKRNLYVMWMGNFLFFVGISMIIPFLAIYVQELGVVDVKAIALWTSFIFAINHFMNVLFSPLWGKLSDRIGQKKVLIISGASMGIVIFMMGWVRSPLELLLLRGVLGMTGGYIAASTALVAIETPKDQTGKALGTLQTGTMSGQLVGPVLGGLLAGTLGMKSAFYTTGVLMVLATIVFHYCIRESSSYRKWSWRLLKQDQRPTDASSVETPDLGLRAILKTPALSILFITSILVTLGMFCVDPIMALYIQEMIHTEHVEWISGLVFMASAMGTLIGSPLLGRLGDSRGHHWILAGSLCCFITVFVIQAVVQEPWALISIRVLYGICIGGITLSVSAMLRQQTPRVVQGRIFSFNAASIALGSVIGSLLGGLLANVFGFVFVFYCVSTILTVLLILLVINWRHLMDLGAVGLHDK